MRNRVRVMCKPGSVGDLGGQPPRSTRPDARTDPDARTPMPANRSDPDARDARDPDTRIGLTPMPV